MTLSQHGRISTLAVLGAAASLRGQPCEPSWSPEFNTGDLRGQASDWVVFDDGSGPALYASGGFDTRFYGTARGVAKFAGNRWSTVGQGLGGQVFALAVYDNGSGPALYAANADLDGNGAYVGNVYRWSGQSWVGVGVTFNDAIRTLEVVDFGNGPCLIAGGDFTKAVGGGNLPRIAQLIGTQWKPIGQGFNGPVYDVAAYDDGSGPALYAGGNFKKAEGEPASAIARWNGASWLPVGGGLTYSNLPDTAAWTLEVYDDGTGPKLYAGGYFSNAGDVETRAIAAWDGSEWSSPNGGVFGDSEIVFAMTAIDLGDGPRLYIGGRFTKAGDVPADRFASWDGSSWEQVGGGIPNGGIASMGFIADDAGPHLFLSGGFNGVAGLDFTNLAVWDGESWTATANGFFSPAMAIEPFGDGVFAAGDFLSAGRFAATRIAHWNGASWLQAGGGFDKRVWDLQSSADGMSLFAAGEFLNAGGGPASHVARWDGQAWSPLGSGTNGTATALGIYNGDLIVGGGFTTAGPAAARRIARWTGSFWSKLGDGLNDLPRSVIVFDDGTGPALYVAGYFTDAGGIPASRIARWDGAAWSALAGGLNREAYDMAAFDDGTGPALYVGGLFSEAGGEPAVGIARWDGQAWSGVGGGLSGNFDHPGAHALAVHDAGAGPALYAAGLFTMAGSTPANYIARWDGAEWSPVDGGFDDGGVTELAAIPDGPLAGLYASGGFNSGGGVLSGRIARLIGCGASCYADCDDSTGEGILDLFDFLCYVNRFNAADPSADCTGDGILDLFDFLCFVNAFNAGC